MFSRELSALLLFLLPVTASAATYFVSPAGNDAAAGSSASPWRTAAKAAATAGPGDIVYFREGAWNERLVPQASGAEGTTIAFAAYPGETATFDGSGIPIDPDAGLVDLTGRHHIRVSGLTVTNAAGSGIYAEYAASIAIEDCRTDTTHGSGIGIWNSSNVVVDGNEVVAACIDGMQEHITIAGTAGFEVKNNHVHGTAPGSNGKEGICLKDGSTDGSVHDNEVDHLHRVGIYVDAWDKHTSRIRVFANRAHDIDAMGFSIASEMGGLLEDVRLENNLAWNTMVGIWVSVCCTYGGPSHPMKTITLINNSCVHNGWDGWGGGLAVENEQVEGLVVRNNLLSDNFSFQLAAPSLSASRLTVDHNLVHPFRGGENEITGDAAIDGDPRLRDAASHDFYVLKGSPAIDAGSAVSAPATDVAGRHRPCDGNADGIAAVDIGAFENVDLVRRRPVRRR